MSDTFADGTLSGTEFDCADCGRHVIGLALSPPDDPARCTSCDWIRRNIPPEHHAEARRRLGVPLKAAPE